MQPNKYPDVVPVCRSAKFPKEARLRKRSEFLKLIKAQHKAAVKGFLVVWSDNNAFTARLGITASKKTGCAVVRNRVKRYLREAFRQSLTQLAPVDINIIARQESARMTYLDVQRELNKAFRIIGISACSRASRSL